MDKIHWTPQAVEIRPFSMDDAPALAAALDDLSISRWLSVVPHPYTLADAHEFLARPDIAADAVLVDGHLVGAVGVAQRLGYWFIPQVWGQGLASHVARQTVAKAFEETPTATLKSGYFLGNDASARVLAKAGFREVSCGQARCHALDKHVRHVNMEATLADWKAVQ